MALPNARQNLVGCQLVNGTDLGLTVASSANVATQTSNTITDDAPRTVVVLATIASGTLALNAKIASGTVGAPDSSPTATYTLSASSLSGYVVFNTTAASLNWALKLTSTNALVTQFAVFDVALIPNKNDSISAGASQLAFESAVNGTGSGSFSINV